MNAKIIQYLLRLRASYYFLPAVMVLGAVALGVITTTADLVYQKEISSLLGWFFGSTVDSARSVLTTIASSMITVAAVTFSLTMVAVTSAAGQYGPRLIGNFMRDRANQVTLGMFLATFIYCMVVLKSVSEDISADGIDSASLAPSLSVLVALLLTLVSVGVLIFFVHHIPETLNVGNITGRLTKSLVKQIEKGRYPDEGDLETIRGDTVSSPFESGNVVTLYGPQSGYIEAVSLEGLRDWSQENGCQLRLRVSPGHFVLARDPVLDLVFDDSRQNDLDEDMTRKLQSFVAIGRERTAHQNILFLADELVEIAARALSPGVNDPFTAINCIHWYGDICLAMSHADNAPDCVLDTDGTPRIWAHTTSFSDVCETLFGKSREYVCEDENAAAAMQTALKHLKERAGGDFGKTIDTELSRLAAAIKQSSLGEDQKQRLLG